MKHIISNLISTEKCYIFNSIIIIFIIIIVIIIIIIINIIGIIGLSNKVTGPRTLGP